MSSTGGAAAREMPIIHRIFRRQFAELRALVQDAPAADPFRDDLGSMTFPTASSP